MDIIKDRNGRDLTEADEDRNIDERNKIESPEINPCTSLGWEDPLEKEMATHSTILA